MGKVVFKDDPISRNLARRAARVNDVVDAVLEHNESSAQNDMRFNAPWTDQTGNARQGLFAQHYAEGDDERGLVLFHTVPYGIYLETNNSGRYEIIMPVVERTGRKVMDDIRTAFRAGAL